MRKMKFCDIAGSLSNNLLDALLDPECSIEHLIVSAEENILDDNLAIKLVKVLKNNQKITIVEVDYEIDENDSGYGWRLDWLLHGLKNNDYSHIKTLFMNDNGVDWNIDDLFDTLNTNTSITHLSCNFSDRIDMRRFKFNKNLTKIWLDASDFINFDFEERVNALRTITSIRLHAFSATQNFAQSFTKLTAKVRDLELGTVVLTKKTLEDWFKFLNSNKDLHKFRLLGTQNELQESSSSCDITEEAYDTLVEKLFEVNWTLVNFELKFVSLPTQASMLRIKAHCERNRRHQIQLNHNIVTALYNISRSKEALDVLPKEVWLLIAENIDSCYDYQTILKELFLDGSIRRLAFWK
jgi:hypothetical protein